MKKLDIYTILVILLITNVTMVAWGLYRVIFSGERDYQNVLYSVGLALLDLVLLKVFSYYQEKVRR